MGSRLTHTAGFWLCFMKLGRDARVTLNLWSAPVRSNRISQKGVERLKKPLPVITESGFCFTEQQADIPLYIMAHVLLEEEIQIWGPNHPCSPKTLQSFFQDKAVKFWVLDKFQRKHNVLICTALTVAVGHTCISLRPYQLFSAVWIVALLCTNLDKSVSALSTGCFNHYIL